MTERERDRLLGLEGVLTSEVGERNGSREVEVMPREWNRSGVS